jgi:glycosyltransferase involved in cell wall biosynthesis
MYAFVELILQFNTHRNIAFWPVEVDYLDRFRVKRRTIFSDILIRNSLDREVPLKKRNNSIENQKKKLICIGRLSKQKDPQFFIETIAALRSTFEEIEVTWIGGGADELRELLISENINVIPWLSKSQIEQHLEECDLTVVTSAWESGPLTVYESLASGTPVAWRTISANSYLNWEHGESPQDLAHTIKLLLSEDKQALSENQLSDVKCGIRVYSSKGFHCT